MVTASDATLNSLKPQPQPSTSTTPTVSHPTSVSATTLRPTRNQPGTRLPTSPAALQSLLAPFSSLPSSSPPHGSFASSTHSNEPPPAPSTSTAQPATGGPGSRMGQDDSQKSDAPGFVSALFADVPGTSRVGVDVSTRVDPKITVRNAWQFLPFLTKQAGNIASSFVSHHLYGPPKKSWGIEMSIFTAFVREAANYTHLSSIHQLRQLLDLGHILPSPNDGIITPVSFKVKRLGLRGFLQALDRAEDGERLLTGEWVVSKKTWKRLQTQTLARRQRHHHLGPEHGFGGPASSAHGLGDEKVIFYIHGGAYFVMSASTHRPITISIAKYTECRLFAVNYRLAPETKFPGPLHDVVLAYMRLIDDLKIPARNIVVSGDSAGGGMALALMMYLRDEGYPMPSGAMLLSPWCDLTMSCDSWETNEPYDFLPMVKPDDPLNPVKCYLGEDGIKKWVTHPYVSPLFGNLHGLPPLLIQAGDAEVLRDEITLLAHKASLHEVKVVHEIYEDCVHVFQFALFLEASKKALQSMRHFVRHRLPRLEAETTEAITNASSCGDGTNIQVSSTTDAEDARSSDEDDSQGSRSSQGELDREITADAHLVDQRSRALTDTLAATTTAPQLPGIRPDVSSDSDEHLSSTDDTDEEPLPFQSGMPASAVPSSDVASPHGSPTLSARATGKSSNTPSATGSHGLSLRGRLPPAMDLQTIRDMLLTRSNRQSTPFQKPALNEQHVGTRPRRRRSDITHLSISTMSIPDVKPPASASVTPTATRSGHVRRHTTVANAAGFLKYSASQSDLLTPQIVRETGRSEARELVTELIQTPSHLLTTVYRQNDAPDSAEYFWSEGTNAVGQGQELRSLDPEEELEEVADLPPVADFAFQTPGYGFL